MSKRAWGHMAIRADFFGAMAHRLADAIVSRVKTQILRASGIRLCSIQLR